LDEAVAFNFGDCFIVPPVTVAAEPTGLSERRKASNCDIDAGFEGRFAVPPVTDVGISVGLLEGPAATRFDNEAGFDWASLGVERRLGEGANLVAEGAGGFFTCPDLGGNFTSPTSICCCFGFGFWLLGTETTDLELLGLVILAAFSTRGLFKAPEETDFPSFATAVWDTFLGLIGGLAELSGGIVVEFD
jgi:hypothetical protein